MWRQPITKDLSLGQTIDLLAENNSKARSILLQCFRVDPILLLRLDSYNCRGQQIVWGFEGYCERKFGKFRECVIKRDPQFIYYINQCAEKMLYPVRAVITGGAPR